MQSSLLKNLSDYRRGAKDYLDRASQERKNQEYRLSALEVKVKLLEKQVNDLIDVLSGECS